MYYNGRFSGHIIAPTTKEKEVIVRALRAHISAYFAVVWGREAAS